MMMKMMMMMGASKKISLVLLVCMAAFAIANAQQWCERTTHQSLCLSIIRSDPRANLKNSPNGIGTILKDRALGTALSTSAKISGLLRRSRNAHEIQILKDCSQGYSRAISSLRSANFISMNHQNYINVFGAMSDANDEPRDCELSFQEPPAIPSPITADNQSLRDICSTALEIITLYQCNKPSAC